MIRKTGRTGGRTEYSTICKLDNTPKRDARDSFQGNGVSVDFSKFGSVIRQHGYLGTGTAEWNRWIDLDRILLEANHYDKPPDISAFF